MTQNKEMATRKTVRGMAVCLGLLLIGLFFSPSIYAHKRETIMTYPAWTAVKGELEMTHWYNAGDEINEKPEQWLELEYGVTNRLQTSLYLITDADKLNYKGWKWENIWRMAAPGKFIVEPALYLEYRHNDEKGATDELEGKLILQKNIGQLNLITNFVWEKHTSGDEQNVKFNRYHVAATYPIASPNATLGLEYTRYTEGKISSIMPVIAVSPSKQSRFLIGWEKPISGENVSPRLRTMLELEF